MEPTVLVEDAGALRTITLHRPERKNALTPQMQEELIAALHAASAESCRIIVLRGAGDAFCGGLDLSALQAMNDKSAAEHTHDAARIARMFRTLYEFEKPTIAVVQGAAIAGGTGLATLCDFTLAAPEARFGYTEVRIGFVPAMVSAYLALQIGDKRARELLLTARLFDAEEACRLGLVNEILPIEALPVRVQTLAQALMRNSPEALRATKRLLVAQNQAWLDRALELALHANAEARATADFREGIASFLEKRKPHWA